MRKVCVAGRALHLPQCTIRHPQAVALSVVLCILAGGTAGSWPSLHVDACASTLRPLFPYGPDERGLPSFPRFPALRCCGSSVRRGIMCRKIGGQGDWQPSLRSRRHTTCPQCLGVASWAICSLLVVHAYGFVSVCSGGRKTVHFAADTFRCY